jgi:hypothetical protein
MERKPPSTSAAPARAHGGVTGARLLAAEKVVYSRSTRLQSTYRDTTQYCSAGDQNTGAAARSRANSG